MQRQDGSATKGDVPLGRYSCYGARANHGTARCITISGVSIDAAVGAEVLRILEPLGIDAAVRAIGTQTSETSAAQRQLELSLQQACVFRGKSATDSGMKSATDSDLISAIPI